MEIYALKVLIVMMFSSWKTYCGPAMSFSFGFSYFEMLIYNIGAALASVLISLKYSRAISRIIRRLFVKKSVPKFNPKFRKYLRFWRKYGLYSIMFLTPVLIGVPVGAFLAVRFGTSKKKAFYIIAAMVVVWSTLFYYLGMFGYNIVGDELMERILTFLHLSVRHGS